MNVKARDRALPRGPEMDSAKAASMLQQRRLRAGLLLSVEEATVTIFPALMVDSATAREGFDLPERSL